MRVFARHHVDAGDLEIGPRARETARDPPVAGTDVEQLRSPREDASEVRGQDADSARGDPTLVDRGRSSLSDAGTHTQHRRIRRMPRKKLDRIDWNPSAKSSTPGMTQRIVSL
jgi:hypothetical protein